MMNHCDVCGRPCPTRAPIGLPGSVPADGNCCIMDDLGRGGPGYDHACWRLGYERLLAKVAALESALRDRMKLCGCHGTGVQEWSCVYCTGDSTCDHECVHRISPCKAEGCIRARDILSEAREHEKDN